MNTIFKPATAFLSLALAAALSVAGLAATPAPASAASVSTATVRATILADTNAFRAKHGLGALTMAPVIARTVAQPWAEKMAKTGDFVHNAKVSAKIPAGWQAWGENIAFGFDYTEIVDAWIASPEHRANLLGDFTQLGIGYTVGADGTTWYVQNFAKYASDKAASASTATSAGSSTPVASISGLKVRDAGTVALRVSGAARKHATMRVSIATPSGTTVHHRVAVGGTRNFALTWKGSKQAGTYDITVTYVKSAAFVAKHSAWTMTFTRG